MKFIHKLVILSLKRLLNYQTHNILQANLKKNSNNNHNNLLQKYRQILMMKKIKICIN